MKMTSDNTWNPFQPPYMIIWEPFHN